MITRLVIFGSMVPVIIVVAVIVLIILFIAGIYNALVRLRNQVRNAWSQIDVQLKRRHDLIPNLPVEPGAWEFLPCCGELSGPQSQPELSLTAGGADLDREQDRVCSSVLQRPGPAPKQQDTDVPKQCYCGDVWLQAGGVLRDRGSSRARSA